MNKKALIITIASLVVAFAIIGILFYMQTFRTIHFDIKKENVKVVIHKDDSTIVSFTADTDVKLQKGDYIYTTDGSNYANTPQSFTVGDDNTTVTVNPPFSDAYRTKVLNAELPAITKVLLKAYPILSTDFTIAEGDIYDDGTWYGTTLTQKPNSASEQGDMYRIVLKKEKADWVIKTKPELVLSARDYPNIPFEILSDLNKKVN